MSNRAERRRQQKAANKSVTYHFTQASMDAYKKQLVDDVIQQFEKRRSEMEEEQIEAIVSQAIVFVLGLSLKILRTEFGWGRFKTQPIRPGSHHGIQ